MNEKWFVRFEVGGDSLVVDSDCVLELGQLANYSVARIGTGSHACAGLIEFRGCVLPLVELRQLLGHTSFRQEIREAQAFVEQRQRDHVNWLNELRRCVETGDEFKLALDPTMCAFGKWYETVRVPGPERDKIVSTSSTLGSIIDAFDAPHRRIHALAEQVLAMRRAGQKDLALQRIRNEEETTLTELIAKFAEYIDAFRRLRIPTMVVIQKDEHRLGVLVDRVTSVAPFGLDKFEPAPDLAIQSGGYCQKIINMDGDIVMALEVNPILQFVLVPEALAA